MTDAQNLAFVRAVHTAIYVVMSAAVFCVLYAGVTGSRGAWLWGPLAMVVIEVVVFASSGMKCPLTALAAKYGSAPGEDTFFPERMTRHTLTFFGPLLGFGFVLLIARWCGALG